MEIAPIGGYRPVTALRQESADLELVAAARVENAARPGDDPAGRRPSRARLHSSSADLELDDSSNTQSDRPSTSRISFFA